MDDLNQVLRARREKLAALNARGIEPFAYNFDCTHRAAEASAAFEEADAAGTLGEDGEGATVRIGGRIVAWRSHGKSAFAHLEDASGRIQLYFKKDVLGSRVVSLDLEETLIALSISATMNPTAQAAVDKLAELRGCEMHITHIPTPGDEAGLRKLGVNLTADPNFASKDLFVD